MISKWFTHRNTIQQLKEEDDGVAELLVKNEKLKGQDTKLDPGLDTQQKYGLPWTSAGRTRRQIKPVRALLGF